MRATVMHSAGDVRIEDVPDAKLVDPPDAMIRVTRACYLRQRPLALHGAALDHFMTHLAIQEADESGSSPVSWGEPVSAEEYSSNRAS